MSKLLKFINSVDWFMAVALFAAAIYLKSGWLAAAGLVSLVTAWFRPAERIKGLLDKYILRRNSTKHRNDVYANLQEDAFYQEVLAKAPARQEQPVIVVPRNAINGGYTASLGSHRTNVLVAESFQPVAVKPSDSPRFF